MTDLVLPHDLVFPQIDLITEDGEPLESYWHRAEINLLIETLRHHWQDRTDYYAGGNMFVYYSAEQARRLDYRGPDFFVVLGVDGVLSRKAWVVWEEDGRYPDVIVELLSPTTAVQDLSAKKLLYERTFHTAEYFCYDPDQRQLIGWRLNANQYAVIDPDPRGWLWSEQLGLWLGAWEGDYLGEDNVWLRFYTADGVLVATERERAVQAEQEAVDAAHRAAQAEQRAHQAETELARLRARLQQLGIDPDTPEAP